MEVENVKTRPILFSDPLVKAILGGRKTVTRRPVKLSEFADLVHPWKGGRWEFGRAIGPSDGETTEVLACPYGKPGDRLFVKESHRAWLLDGGGDLVRIEYRSGGHRDVYADDLPDGFVDRFKCRQDGKTLAWKPSIFMAREASRITLEITDVRVERVQDISAQQVRAEGIRSAMRSESAYVGAFARLWDSIYAGRTDKPGLSWTDNPWVWVVEFKRI